MPKTNLIEDKVTNYFALSSFVFLIASFFPIALSYYIQYSLELYPCKLCLYQRYLYFFLSLYFLSSFIIEVRPIIKIDLSKKVLTYWRIQFLIFSLLLFSISFFLSLFHFGVEQGWWNYSSTCVTNLKDALSLEDFITSISKSELVPCNISQFEFYGLTLSGLNMLYSLALLILALAFTFKIKKNIKFFVA